MTGMNITGQLRKNIERGRENREQALQNREYVRRLLHERQPDFASVLESIETELCYLMGLEQPDERNAASCCRAV